MPMMQFDSVRERRAGEKEVLGGARTVIIKRYCYSLFIPFETTNQETKVHKALW